MGKSKYSKICKCTECSKGPSGCQRQTAQTFREHQLNDRLRDVNQEGDGNVELELGNEMEVDSEVPVSSYDSSLNHPEIQTIPADDLEFDNEILHYLNDEMDDHASDVQNADAERIPENGNAPEIIHFMQGFLVLYQLVFTTRRGATILLRFFNLMLAALGIMIQLPVTPSTVRRHTGFDRLTEHIVRYIACSNCHTLYEPTLREMAKIMT